MAGANISPEAMDRYFDRQDHKAQAQAQPCPDCGAEPGQQCKDRWGIPTSLVHQARHTDGYQDPYAL